MASMWVIDHFLEAVEDNADTLLPSSRKGPNMGNSLVIAFYQNLLENFKSTKDFETCLKLYLSVWEFLPTVDYSQVEAKGEVEGLLDTMALSARHIFLTGEWMQQSQELKNHYEEIVLRCSHYVSSRKQELDKLICLMKDPWGSKIRRLLTGKKELQQQVLELVSSEGVDQVLLRMEMLVESGMDNGAYRFATAVATSLLADHIVFQSYVATSRPGSLERIVDIFLALAVSLRHDSRLYNVMKLIGLEEVNNTYVPRFKHYLKQSKSGPETARSDETSKEGNGDDDEPMIEAEKQKVPDPVESTEEDDLPLCQRGRCSRILNKLVSEKILEIFFNWSLATAAVKDSDDMAESLITDWVDSAAANKEQMIRDVDTLMVTATKTAFLYHLAYQVWRKLGKNVEEKCLKIFIRALTSDINEQEASQKNKNKRKKIEKRLAHGFWLLSKIVADRVALSRECVLTSFSIVPTQEKLDKIRELAKFSGLDKFIDEDLEVSEADNAELSKRKVGLHCRVSLGEEEKKAQGFTKVYMAKMLKHLEQARSVPLEESFKLLSTLKKTDLVEKEFSNLENQLDEGKFARAEAKFRSKVSWKERKERNLEGLLSIHGELVTDAANYDPADDPCKSLKPENLMLPKYITDDLVIVISAPRWHLLNWILPWNELERMCRRLLENPEIREPKDELKYLNIDYTQFDEWSSDEEVTIYTGIEKGYERWVEHNDYPEEESRTSEQGISDDEDEIDFKVNHTIDREDYNDLDKYLGPDDYLLVLKDKAEEVIDEASNSNGKDNNNLIGVIKNETVADSSAPMEVAEDQQDIEDEFCRDEIKSPTTTAKNGGAKSSKADAGGNEAVKRLKTDAKDSKSKDNE